MDASLGNRSGNGLAERGPSDGNRSIGPKTTSLVDIPNRPSCSTNHPQSIHQVMTYTRRLETICSTRCHAIDSAAYYPRLAGEQVLNNHSKHQPLRHIDPFTTTMQKQVSDQRPPPPLHRIQKCPSQATEAPSDPWH